MEPRSAFFCANDAENDGDWRSSKLHKTLPTHLNMLSFSSPLPQLPPVPPKNNTGYYCGVLNSSSAAGNGNGNGNNMYGDRGAFTASQWVELEQQALIFKYMTANAPIPSHLLHSPAFLPFSSTAWGWSPYRLGYANSTDPEPGRCRRTDGKKWRCAKDAVPDQKYCERHINRGRHRSRKHVEAQSNAHSLSGGSNSAATKVTAPPPVAASSTSFDINHQAKNRMIFSPENGSQGLLQGSSGHSFLSLSDSSLHRGGCNEEFTITNGDSNHGIVWPGLQLQSDTSQQLSNSMSSTDEDKAGFMPFRHSQQLEMGLGVGAQSYNNRQASWMSSSWEPTTMGGPLGEALQSNSIANGEVLNLLPNRWDGMGGYHLSSSSPTGVLQRSSLVSLSNSSACSSPRTDNSKAMESVGSFYNDLK